MGCGLTVVNAISSIDSLRTLGSTCEEGGGYFFLLPTTFNAPSCWFSVSRHSK